jgi:hypothetical protein
MKAILAIAVVAGMTAFASADPIIWDNGPGDGGTSLSSQLALDYPFDSQCADDFMFDVDSLVTDVHWWGTWWNGAGSFSTDFNIYFYLTDPNTGYPELDGSGNPAPIATYNFYGVPDNGLNGAEYDVVLDEPFAAEAGVHYWIGIQAEEGFYEYGQWGWTATNTGPQLTECVQGFPLLGIPYWTDTDYGDLAYYLTGIPAPGALALLGMAGLIGRRRR